MQLLKSELNRLAHTAAGRAAEALAMLLYKEVKVRGPRVYHLSSPEMLLLRIRSPRHLFCVTQTLVSEHDAKVSFTFDHHSASQLADLLIGRGGSPGRPLCSLGLDALKEAANIVNCSFVGPLCEPLRLSVAPSVPSMLEGALNDLIFSFAPHPQSLCVDLRLLVRATHLEVMLLMAMAPRLGELATELTPSHSECVPKDLASNDRSLPSRRMPKGRAI